MNVSILAVFIAFYLSVVGLAGTSGYFLFSSGWVWSSVAVMLFGAILVYRARPKFTHTVTETISER
ncbi:hypothetical protein DYI37_03855 [Fulvimarina endophytica]|uniref:Uncharacterized protein n=1 Tax=Fulvimarina endophytica TaxID=2293836 RepID=A0A371X706_9HYPH|nr:hypothetical protein [Fulvimarina endophytica]RFC65010.1 hypothetical protein DYI37_03855 [Fulvimarina endophytica]